MRGCRSTSPARAGWSSIPPTASWGNRDLIRIAVARDPAQAVPLSGTFFGLSSDDLGMRVDVEVADLSHDGRAAGLRERNALPFQG